MRPSSLRTQRYQFLFHPRCGARARRPLRQSHRAGKFRFRSLWRGARAHTRV